MTRMCKNGCNELCYPARLVCRRCVADESLARKKRAQGKGVDGKILQQQRIESRPLDGYNEIMGRMARVSLRVAV